MEIHEAIKEIKSRKKTYLDVGMSQSQFSQMCLKAESNILKEETLRDFLKKFGYNLVVEKKAFKNEQ